MPEKLELKGTGIVVHWIRLRVAKLASFLKERGRKFFLERKMEEKHEFIFLTMISAGIKNLNCLLSHLTAHTFLPAPPEEGTLTAIRGDGVTTTLPASY